MSYIEEKEKWLLIAIGYCLALVSATCEVLLFIEQAEGIDLLINSVTAVCLVGCQFVFVYVAMRFFKLKQLGIGIPMLLTVIVLFYVSVSGSASYFEARYNKLEQKSTAISDEYIELTELIRSYKSTSMRFEALADKEVSKGNNWQASQNQKQAAEANQKWQSALNSRGQIISSGQTGIEALAVNYQNNDSVIWYVYAILIDLCPLLCFAALGILNQSSVVTKQDKRSTSEAVREHIEVVEVRSIFKDELYAVVANEISAGFYGERPSQRKVKERHNFNSNPRVKKLFDQLEENGVIARDDSGRTYRRIGELSLV